MIRDSKRVEHYRAKQAQPVFASAPERRYVTRQPFPWRMLATLLGAAALGAVFVLLVL